MRTNSCPICHSVGAHVFYGPTLPAQFDERHPPSPYSAHYRIMQCEGCGLLFSDPIMDKDGVSILYQGLSETNVTPGEEDNVRRTMAGYYGLAAPYLPGRDRILDVGCDIGLLLEVARQDGFRELHGIEPVPAARQQSASLPGAQITDVF